MAWRELVLGFFANLVAGNTALRAKVVQAMFPHDLALVVTLCPQRPHLAFLLAQNIFSSSSSGVINDSVTVPPQLLLETPDGHCFIFILLSLLRASDDGVDSDTEASIKTREWASVFFHSLWASGSFPPIYRGVKLVTLARMHTFLCHVVGIPVSLPSADYVPPAAALASLVGLLGGHAEVLGLLWHTIHGLLAGPGETCDKDASAPPDLAHELLGDSNFVELAAEEMSVAVAVFAERWHLFWSPLETSAEALSALGVTADEIDAHNLAAQATVMETCVPAPESTPDHHAAHEHVIREVSLDVSMECKTGGFFWELMQASIALAAAPRESGDPFPARLTGIYLTANLALVDALHRMRFGDAASSQHAVKSAPSPQAVEASLACLLVEQVRLCGNVLYNHPRAQNFVRLVGGVRVLLSHCYADHELPLLREAGVFAVRNATHRCEANQAAVREVLAKRQVPVSEASLDGAGGLRGDEVGESLAMSLGVQ